MVSLDQDAITASVEKVLRLLPGGLNPDRTGPIPLDRLFSEMSVMHTSIPNLTRDKVRLHLMEQGQQVGDLGQADEPLAGFLFAAGRVGWAYVNASDMVQRRRFTAAHELGHFMLHRQQMVSDNHGDTEKSISEGMEEGQLQKMEQEANRFAAELLIPELVCQARAESMKRKHGTVPRHVLIYRLSSEFLVSREAMRYRLNTLELGDG